MTARAIAAADQAHGVIAVAGAIGVLIAVLLVVIALDGRVDRDRRRRHARWAGRRAAGWAGPWGEDDLEPEVVEDDPTVLPELSRCGHAWESGPTCDLAPRHAGPHAVLTDAGVATWGGQPW